jgi:hypothetical protein
MTNTCQAVNYHSELAAKLQRMSVRILPALVYLAHSRMPDLLLSLRASVALEGLLEQADRYRDNCPEKGFLLLIFQHQTAGLRLQFEVPRSLRHCFLRTIVPPTYKSM